MKNLFILIIPFLLISSCTTETRQTGKTKLPTHYSFDRFYLTPVTLTGDTLMLYTDTGGGANMLYEHTLDKVNLKVNKVPAGEDSARTVSMPPFKKEASIPLPPSLGPFGQQLMVVSSNGHSGSGFLGRLYFATRIWEFDYPNESLNILEESVSPVDKSPRVPLGFQTDSAGTPTTYFPRITIEVEGDSIDMLFDTGATVNISEETASELNIPGATEIGTSFIVESIFKRWQEDHPEWQVIENADERLNMPMIKVPTVSIANYEVGPVWFTMRPDENFTGYMSQWMDKKIEGAVGGSAFKYFRITVDYPNRVAYFRK